MKNELSRRSFVTGTIKTAAAASWVLSGAERANTAVAPQERVTAAGAGGGRIVDIHLHYKKEPGFIDDFLRTTEHLNITACMLTPFEDRKEVAEAARAFDLEGVLGGMKCPYLIINGAHDVLSVEACNEVYQYAVSKGMNVTLRLTDEEETGADHCQHDNPTIGQELMLDWLTDTFGIDQTKLTYYAG